MVTHPWSVYNITSELIIGTKSLSEPLITKIYNIILHQCATVSELINPWEILMEIKSFLSEI